MKTCCFIGHKDCDISIKNSLFKTIEMLITSEKVMNFYVGTQGNFDKYVYEVLCELNAIYDLTYSVVLAYLNQASKNIYYDINKTLFPDELTRTPPRFAIKKRNMFMINKSDYIITYLNTPSSNTYTNIVYALKKHKQIINLGSYSVSNIFYK